MLIRATSSKGKFYPAIVTLQVLPCRYYNISIGKFTLILGRYGLTIQEYFTAVLLCLPNNNLSLTSEFSR
jgi:hypothetical protein